MKTRRINTGLYELKYKGKTFEIEGIHVVTGGECCPGWMVYEMQDGVREYWGDYGTKKDAVANTVAYMDSLEALREGMPK